jgi:hypothetical protein
MRRHHGLGLSMPYFWVSEEDKKAWEESGLSIGEWRRSRLQEQQAAALITHPLWPAVQRWLPAIFPITNWGERGAEFGYQTDPGRGDSFQPVLVLKVPLLESTINWQLNIPALGELVSRAVTAAGLSGPLTLDERQPQMRVSDLAGTLRTAAEVEQLATVLGDLRWPQPPT